MLKWYFRLPLDCRFKHVYRLAVGFILISVLTAFVSIVFMIWPTKIIDIELFEVYEAVGGDRAMKSYQIAAGDELEFEVKFYKYIPANATVTELLKQVNNGYLYPFPEIKTTRMPVGKWHYKSSLVIPKSTPPGKYAIVRNYHYIVNSLRTQDIELKSNEFEVIKPRKDIIKLIEEGNEVSKQNQKILKGSK